MRSATGDSKTHYNYAHTSTSKAASLRHHFPSSPLPFVTTSLLHQFPSSSLPFVTTSHRHHFPPSPLPFVTPQNIAHATSCTHSSAICNRRFQNTLELRTHKHTQSSFKPPLHCEKKKRPTDPSRTRRTHEVPFIVACSHFTRKNTRFRAPASSPKHSPCNIMQPFQCDLQPEIPKHTITTHTQAHPKQLQATVTHRQKKNDHPTPAAPVAHTRYLSSPAAATLHGKTQGFVLRLPPQNIAHATSCSHSNAICNRRFQNTL